MRFRHARRGVSAALAMLLALTGCAENPIEPDCAAPSDAAGSFTVSGTLRNRTGVPVPENARVMVAWVVSATSPDYTYVYGEGTVQPACNAFQITFENAPPTEALNLGKLGVGVIFLTTDPTLREGADVGEVDPTRIIGAAGRYGVIYIAPDAGETLDWARSFPAGYSVGKGVQRPGGFDAFTPEPPSSVELIVDALENIDFVNWT